MVEERAYYEVNAVLFSQLILSFQASAMQQLGKIMNPFTQKIERNLSQAKMSIDMLAMIQEKTRGNLGDEESRLLDRILFELRMNYIDEVNKDKKKAEQEKSEEAAAVGEQDRGGEKEAGTLDKSEGTKTAEMKHGTAPGASDEKEGEKEDKSGMKGEGEKERVKTVKAGRTTKSTKKKAVRTKRKHDSA